MEEQLHDVSERGTSLTEWLLEHWSDSGRGELGDWERYAAPCDCWYHVKFWRAGQESLIQVDVLGGAFLVDGRPVGRLPLQISGSDCYSRLFRNTVFDVQPTHGGKGFKTKKISGAFFAFHVDDDDQVIITEEREVDGRGVKATLVPRGVSR